MTDTRLIERWLPIAEIGEESIRERRSMTSLPPTYYLHVWWARRPLVASRAAVLASLLPADADREKFLHILGIHGDPIAARDAIDTARRTGDRIDNPYTYNRAFNHSPNKDDLEYLDHLLDVPLKDFIVLDPTTGGGSIPFETIRLGLNALANDLNPVAAFITEAALEWPILLSRDIQYEFNDLSARWRKSIEVRLKDYFPQEDEQNFIDTTYLWARTITCPYCAGLVPLSPNWRLASSGIGIKLIPHLGKGPGTDGRICSFDIVGSDSEQSQETVSRGDGICPYPDCGRIIPGDEIKVQAQSDRMNEQLFAVVYKELTFTTTKTGKVRKKWIRKYRSPCPGDDNLQIKELLVEKMPEWEAFDIIPMEKIPDGNKTSEPQRYGMATWCDLFSPRQLLCHCTSVEVFRELLELDRKAGRLNDSQLAAYGYLALSLDTFLNYNNRAGRWDSKTCRVRSIFDRHDFAFVWSYGEMAPLVPDLGYDWAINKTAKCIDELINLLNSRSNKEGDLFDSKDHIPPSTTITCKPGDSLDHIQDGSVDAVIMDPPYYDNVMYAELSDFFYVWLKRTAGYVFPDLFRRQLTDKDNEAVANPAKFKDQQGAKARAGRDYQERMAAIFAECRRVLKPNGIMTLMFTHKATGAWDALTKGLIEAGFVITASWPINTEASDSLHIKNKAAANSTIFLVCRPRDTTPEVREDVYWEDIEQEVAQAVRSRIKEFEEAGIRGVDLYLACFGPALEKFSRYWPLKRGTPRNRPDIRRRRQFDLFEEEWDPYAVTPEDALDAARREVKRWRLTELTHAKTDADLDPTTAFFVLAWDAFHAPTFPYDEALRLAHAVGADLEKDIVGRLAAKKNSNILLWDSAQRAAKGSLGSTMNGPKGMIDAIHHVAHAIRSAKTLQDVSDMISDAQLDQNPQFFKAFEAVLEVLPVSGTFSGMDAKGEAAAAGDDFEVLYNLSRFAYADKIDEPEQLKLLLHDEGLGDAS